MNLKAVAAMAAAVWTALTLLPSRGTAAFPEPDGFGKATFGLPEARVKALYPQAQGGNRPTPAPGQQPAPFTLTTLTLEKQTLGPLHDCVVGFRFFQGELYEVQFRCPDKEQTTAYLQKRFGLPTRTTPTTLIWEGTKASVTHVPKGGVFMFGDVARSRVLQTTILGEMSKAQQRNAAATPNPTPH